MSAERNSSAGFDWLKKRTSSDEEQTDEAPAKTNSTESTNAKKQSSDGKKPTTSRTKKEDKPPQQPRARKKSKIAKRNDPDYELMGVYVRKETRRHIDQALAARAAYEDKVQYSELVETLLVEWLEKQGFPPSSSTDD